MRCPATLISRCACPTRNEINGRRSNAALPIWTILTVTLSGSEGKAPLQVTARANIVETTAPVYYTFGADTRGVCHNAMVAGELYGPAEEDYRFLTPQGLKPRIVTTGKISEVIVEFRLDRPGQYRLRAATVDLAGRSTISWSPIVVDE